MQEENSSERGEECQCDDLHDDARECNIAPQAQLAKTAFSANGQSPTGGLQAQGNAIAADEKSQV